MEQTPQTTLTKDPRSGEALTVRRLFTQAGVHPFDTVEWETRTAAVGSFRQDGVEFPSTWSQNATNIVAQKYFRGQLDSPARERSVKQMIGRVSGTIADWGRERGYFASVEDGDAFEAELTYILLHQLAAFNAPVWFNVGFEEQPQCSACFILSVEDTMDSILDWNTKEGRIFRGGSGSGINLSRIRGSMEPLAKGGTASGPVSFMRGARLVGGHDQVRRQDAPRGQDGGARRRPPRHPRVHLVQGQGGGQGRRAARRRVRHVDRRRRLPLDPVPERQQLRPRERRVHARGRERRGLAAHLPHHRRADRDGPRARADARDLRGGLALRRSGRPVRHHDQPVAHLAELGPHQRFQPLQRVHARRRLGVQPGVTEPHEVPPPGRDVRRRSLQPHGRRRVPRAGDHRRPVELSDRADRQERARVPPARAGLREPRRLPDGQRLRLRLGRGSRRGGRHHGADDRPGLHAVGEDRGRDRPVRPLRREPRRAQQCDADAPRRFVRGAGQRGRGRRAAGRGARDVERRGRPRRAPRLPQRAGDGAGPHGDDLVPDGLRHDRHRARLLARQVQGAGRRRDDDDRQPHGADGAAHARLLGVAGRADRGVRGRARHDRRRT